MCGEDRLHRRWPGRALSRRPPQAGAAAHWPGRERRRTAVGPAWTGRGFPRSDPTPAPRPAGPGGPRRCGRSLQLGSNHPRRGAAVPFPARSRGKARCDRSPAMARRSCRRDCRQARSAGRPVLRRSPAADLPKARAPAPEREAHPVPRQPSTPARIEAHHRCDTRFGAVAGRRRPPHDPACRHGFRAWRPVRRSRPPFPTVRARSRSPGSWQQRRFGQNLVQRVEQKVRVVDRERHRRSYLQHVPMPTKAGMQHPAPTHCVDHTIGELARR